MGTRSGQGVLAGGTRLFCLVLVTAALALAMLVIGQRLFTPFHTVISGSMEPQIKAGDAIVMSDVSPGDVKLGQVIIFRDPQHASDYVIHRVVAIDRTGGTPVFSTKGDNNPVPDDWRVSSAHVVGGVFLRLPGFGEFLGFVMTPRGYLSCVAIPGAVSLSLIFLMSLSEATERKEREPAGFRARPLPAKSFSPGPTGL